MLLVQGKPWIMILGSLWLANRKFDSHALLKLEPLVDWMRLPIGGIRESLAPLLQEQMEPLASKGYPSWEHWSAVWRSQPGGTHGSQGLHVLQRLGAPAGYSQAPEHMEAKGSNVLPNCEPLSVLNTSCAVQGWKHWPHIKFKVE